ncbi:hypothetical protein [Fibrella forsythiae]|uniref:Calcineurin-like phosphoesterase domain-containing protein n=1 Tax=Fibrella forsythiae TaxID=2817061 RepID=A0ABS3JBF9_9BACT|nr:hypothetical protein [Fibrella forsythiae]MBO0947322.1 hypothetical protein [Fibrella forsythiae]
MKTLLIGDVHGLLPNYFKVLAEHRSSRSIQLGDFQDRQCLSYATIVRANHITIT